MKLRQMILAPLALALGTAAEADFINPDSATASSTFSSLYDVGNTIDGSGLGTGFTASTPHADYAANNHWTTANFGSNAALVAARPTATFFFDAAQDVAAFYLWNHRSNVISYDPNYAVRLFNLAFRDGDGNLLSEITDLTASQGVAAAQAYNFDLVQGVRSVELTVLDNFGSVVTGFAEVRFGGAAVPEPGSALLLSAAIPVLAGAALVRRRTAAA